MFNNLRNMWWILKSYICQFSGKIRCAILSISQFKIYKLYIFWYFLMVVVGKLCSRGALPSKPSRAPEWHCPRSPPELPRGTSLAAIPSSSVALSSQPSRAPEGHCPRSPPLLRTKQAVTHYSPVINSGDNNTRRQVTGASHFRFIMRIFSSWKTIKLVDCKLSIFDFKEG